MRKITLFKNGETIVLTQSGEYIVGGKKYHVDIDFDSGKVELSYICDTENIDAKVKTNKLKLYDNTDHLDSESNSKYPVSVYSSSVYLTNEDECYLCLNEDDKDKLIVVKDNSFNDKFAAYKKFVNLVDMHLIARVLDAKKAELSLSRQININLDENGNSNISFYDAENDVSNAFIEKLGKVDKVVNAKKDLGFYYNSEDSENFGKNISDLGFIDTSHSSVSTYENMMKSIILAKFYEFDNLSSVDTSKYSFFDKDNAFEFKISKYIENGVEKRKLEATNSRYSYEQIKEVLIAINSIYVDDFKEFSFSDEDGNVLEKYYAIDTEYTQSNVNYYFFASKNIKRSLSTIAFDEVVFNFEICDDLLSLEIFDNPNLSISHNKCAASSDLQQDRLSKGLDPETGEFHFTIHPEHIIDYPDTQIFYDGEAVYERGVYVKCTYAQYAKVKPYVNAPKVIISDAVTLPDKLFSDIEELEVPSFGVHLYGTGVESPKLINGDTRSCYELVEKSNTFIETMIFNLNDGADDYYSDDYYKLNYDGFIGKDRDAVVKIFGAAEAIVNNGYHKTLKDFMQIEFYDKLRDVLHGAMQSPNISATIDAQTTSIFNCVNTGDTMVSSSSTASTDRCPDEADMYTLNHYETKAIWYIFDNGDGFKSVNGTNKTSLVIEKNINWGENDVNYSTTNDNAQQQSDDALRSALIYTTYLNDPADFDKYKYIKYSISAQYSNDTKSYDVLLKSRDVIFKRVTNHYLEYYESKYTKTYKDDNGVCHYDVETTETKPAFQECIIEDVNIEDLLVKDVSKKPIVEKDKVIYNFKTNEDGSIEITWTNGGIDAKFFTIGDKKVLIPTGGN